MIVRVKMGNNRLRFSVVFIALVGAIGSQSADAAKKYGSTTLCGSIGPHVVAADANLAQAAQRAVAIGTDDADILSGTHAKYGSAFKMVEDDQKLLPGFFHAGMNEVTDGQIAANSLTLPAEVKLAANSLDSYSNSLNAVEEFGSFALLYERSVNAKNRRSKMVAMSEAFAALGDYSNSTTTLNASCFGNSCYGTANTSSYHSNSGAANQQAAAIGASAVAGAQASLDQATPVMVDITQKIDNYQYGYRRLRAVWLSACPHLDFPDHWAEPSPSATAPQ